MSDVATKLAKHHPNVDPYYWTKRPQELKDINHPYTLTQAERDSGTIDPYKIVPGDGKPSRHQIERAEKMSKLQPGTISILPDGSFAHKGVPIDWKEWHGAEQYDWRKEFPEGLPEYIGPMHIKDVPPGYRSPAMVRLSLSTRFWSLTMVTAYLVLDRSKSFSDLNSRTEAQTYLTNLDRTVRVSFYSTGFDIPLEDTHLMFGAFSPQVSLANRPAQTLTSSANLTAFHLTCLANRMGSSPIFSDR